MDGLTLADCRRLTDWVIERTAGDGGKPVAIAICDGAGYLISLTVMDGVPVRSAHFAQHKAYTAARMQAASGAFGARIKAEETDIRFYCDPKLTGLPGGAPIVAAGNRVIGAIGISGRPSEEDQQLANAAAALIG
jgi:glc operon protein GlcG